VRHRAAIGCCALAVLAAGCGGEGGISRRAETVPDEALPVAADTIVVPYANLPVAAPLGEHTWVAVFAEHDAAVIVDFATGRVRPVGGADNPEIAKPFNVFSLGDTVVIADWGKQRLSLWAPDGSLVGTVPAPDATRGLLPRARDAAGQYYFEVPPLPGPDGSGNRDSIAIVRANASMTVFDTVANLAPIDVAEVQLPTGRRYERLIFSATDQWGVRPDGRLWIARLASNRVNTVTQGNEVKGEPLPDPVLEVRRIDREVFINAFPEEVRGSL